MREVQTEKLVLSIIDDDKDDRMLFRNALEQVAPYCSCSEATNGKEGLEQLLQAQILPDIVFLDINMPLMNGWQLLSAVKANPKFKQLDVIMFSTSSSERDKFIAKEFGASGYCVKPDDPIDLKEIAAHIVGHGRVKPFSIPDFSRFFKSFKN